MGWARPESPQLFLNPPSQALLSHRPREVTVSLRATGLVLKAIPASETEGEELGIQGKEREGEEGERWGERRGELTEH